MKNRILSLVLCLVLAVAVVIGLPQNAKAATAQETGNGILENVLKQDGTFPATLPEGQTTHSAYCYACGKEAQWKPLTAKPSSSTSFASGDHYYLPSNVSIGGQLFLWNAKKTLCIHTNGKTLTDPSYRIVLVNSGGTLNIMGGGAIEANTKDNRGILYANGACSINVYGTTLKNTATENDPAYGNAVLCAYSQDAVMNCWGAKLIGNDLSPVLLNNGTMNLYNCTVTGMAAQVGNYADRTDDKAVLNLYDTTISGVDVQDGVGLTAHGATKIGSLNMAEGTTFSASDLTADASIAGYPTKAMLVDAAGKTAFAQDVSAEWATGKYQYIRLFGDVELALDGQEIVVDLCGNDLKVTGSGTVKAFDTANDTFDESACGVLLAGSGITVEKSFQAPNGSSYIAVTENGQTKLHRLEIVLNTVTLRTSAAGLYYKATYNCDQTLSKLVENYGVVVSLYNLPGADFMTEPEAGNFNGWTEAAAPFQSGAVATSGSVFGILKDSRSAATNDRYGRMKIYANAYIALGDEIIVANTADAGKTADSEGFSGVAMSLYDVMQALDATYSTYPTATRLQLDAFYAQWKEKGMAWDFSAIGTSTGITGKIDNSDIDLKFDEGTTDAVCPVCNEKVTWTAFVPSSDSQGLTGHYYLTDDVTFTGTGAAGIFYSSTKNQTLCFHLNGHDLTATKTRAIFGSSGKLNVMGNGTVTGTNTSAEIGSAIQTNNTVAGNTVRLYGGTYKRASGSKGAVIGTQSCGEIYVYEGATLDAPGNKAVIQNAPTYNRNSFVGLYGCTVNGDIINNGSGSYKSTLEIVDATVNGTVQLAESNLSVGGAAKITGIDMGSEIRLQVGQLTDGASIGIVNSGIFMDKGEYNAAYAKYFKGTSPADRITLKDGALHCGRDYLSDLQFEEGTTNALCPVCGEVKTWIPVDGSAVVTGTKANTHYYLTQDIEFTGEEGVLAMMNPAHGTHTVCIHLNGHNFTGTNTRFIYGSTCVTNIMGSGTVTGNRSDKYPYGSTVQINVASTAGTVNLYGGTWTQGEGTDNNAKDYVIALNDNGGNINIYADAKIVANSNGNAVYLGKSNMANSTMTISGTVEGDVFVAAPVKTFTNALTLDGCDIRGTVALSVDCVNTSLTISHAAKVQLLNIPEAVQATLDNLTPGAKIVVKNEGIFTKANSNAAQFAKFFEAQSCGDQIIVQDDQLRCKTDYEAKLYVDETGIAYCPVCKKNVQWTAVSSSEEGIVAVNGGHYYLTTDIVYEKPYDGDTNTAFFNGVPARNSSTCLHLNGHNLTATKCHGIFTGWGLTNIMGEGVVSGYASGTGTSSAVQINNSSPGSGVHLYSGTYRSQADSKSQYVAGMSAVGGGLYIYEDADITSTTGKAIKMGEAGYRDANLEIYGATIVGDIDTAAPKSTFKGSVVLKNATVNGKLELKSGNDLTLEGLTRITKLQIAAGEIVNFVDLKPGSSIAVAASGIFSGVLEQADAWLEYITCATPGDWINVRDNQFCQSIKTAIPTASADDQAALLDTYAGAELRYGEMHNHSNSGPYRDDGTGISVSTGADGKNSLEEWIAEMDKLKMDFAFIVDHGQSIHMYKENFPNWREDYFIGGTEPGTTITDSKASQAKPHYNMLFADAASLESIFFKYEDKYKPIQWTAENYPTAQNPYDYGYRVKYPQWTTAEFAQLAKDVYAAGGLLVQVHPKYDSYIYSDDPMDYYFADYTGFEITTGSGGDMMYKDNNEAYDTWVDLLEMGKIVYATAGSDRHRLPDYSGLAAIYTVRDHRDDYMAAVRVGNMAPGWVGIRMNVNGTLMGGETSFVGQRLQFSVGDIYNPGVTDYCGTENPYVEGHTYRVELYDDGGLLMAANIDPLQMNYFAIDCDEEAMFYRVVVWDVTDQERIGVSNPIWNTAE